MRFLIVEDKFIDRKVLKQFLKPYAHCDIAVNGNEAVESVKVALEEEDAYDAIFLDIVMPDMDGQEALQRIRLLEKEKGVVGFEECKVIMITALDDPQNVIKAYYEGRVNSYLVKPIEKEKLYQELEQLRLFVIDSQS